MDDILFPSAIKTLLNKLKKKLMGRFKMFDMGDVLGILGMNVTRDCKKGSIPFSQKDYTDEEIQRYGMEGCNLSCTP